MVRQKSTMAERKSFNNETKHPSRIPSVVFMDTTTGYKFLSGSTKSSNETVEFEGATYSLVRVEISSDSHPFYTGRQKFTQADGRVDRFNKNTVSNKKPHLSSENVDIKPFSRSRNWLFLFLVPFLVPSWKINYLTF